MKPGFYLTYALRSLHREGQRSLLAVTCIAFGVLALVSMQLLAAMIDDVFLVDPVLSNGGHVTLQPTTATQHYPLLTKYLQNRFKNPPNLNRQQQLEHQLPN